MEKRFIEVGTMQPHCDEQCPLVVEQVLIFKDTENDVWFLTPKIKNEYESAVLALTVGYEAVDAEQTVIEKENGYVIDDVDITQDAEGYFGEDLPITLEKTDVAGGRFFIEEIHFADGYVWSAEKDETEEEEEKEPEDVTMVKTISGFGPDGATFRKIPLSLIVAQRMGTQFITTILALALCVWSLANTIGFIRQSDEALTDAICDVLLESGMQDIETVEDAKKFTADNDLVSIMRYVYIAAAVLVGSSILYSVYLVYYLKETRKYLKKTPVTDTVLTAIIKRLKLLSIIQIVLCIVCELNFLGMIAGISGLSVASLHRRIMKSKKQKQESQIG